MGDSGTDAEVRADLPTSPPIFIPPVVTKRGSPRGPWPCLALVAALLLSCLVLLMISAASQLAMPGNTSGHAYHAWRTRVLVAPAGWATLGLLVVTVPLWLRRVPTRVKAVLTALAVAGVVVCIGNGLREWQARTSITPELLTAAASVGPMAGFVSLAPPSAALRDGLTYGPGFPEVHQHWTLQSPSADPCAVLRVALPAGAGWRWYSEEVPGECRASLSIGRATLMVTGWDRAHIKVSYSSYSNFTGATSVPGATLLVVPNDGDLRDF